MSALATLPGAWDQYTHLAFYELTSVLSPSSAFEYYAFVGAPAAVSPPQPFFKAVDFYIPSGRRLATQAHARVHTSKRPIAKQQRHRRRLEQQEKGVFYPFI